MVVVQRPTARAHRFALGSGSGRKLDKLSGGFWKGCIFILLVLILAAVQRAVFLLPSSMDHRQQILIHQVQQQDGSNQGDVVSSPINADYTRKDLDGEEDDGKPDYGGLKFKPDPMRRIHPADRKIYDRHRGAFLEAIDKKRMPTDTVPYVDTVHRKCRPPKWKFKTYPACNAVHEISSIADEHVQYLSRGLYRQVFRYNQRHDTDFALKRLRYAEGFDFDEESVWYIRKEAMILNELTGSPYYADLYGYCATTTMTQLGRDLNFDLVPLPNWLSRHKRRKTGLDPKAPLPHNDLTPERMLEVAIDVVASIAELHGFSKGLICHDDISLEQWLWNDQNKPFMNDVNSVRVMEWDTEKQEYCPYHVYLKGGEFRPAETFTNGRTSTEKNDMFSVGNMLFAIVIGRQPWFEFENTDDSQAALREGKIPPIEERERSYIENRMIEIMRLCHKFEPSERADVFTVYRLLKELQEEVQKQAV